MASFVYLGVTSPLGNLTLAGAYATTVLFSIAAVLLLFADWATQRYAAPHFGSVQRTTPQLYISWASSTKRLVITTLLTGCSLAFALDTFRPVSQLTAGRLDPLLLATTVLIVSSARNAGSQQSE